MLNVNIRLKAKYLATENSFHSDSFSQNIYHYPWDKSNNKIILIYLPKLIPVNTVCKFMLQTCYCNEWGMSWETISYSMQYLGQVMRKSVYAICKQQRHSRAPAAQRQMRKKISFGPTFFHLAQTFGAYFFRRHFYFFLCYKWYELRKRLLTPNKQCRWRVFLNWWWPLVIIGYKVRPIIDTYLVDWTWCFI